MISNKIRPKQKKYKELGIFEFSKKKQKNKKKIIKFFSPKLNYFFTKKQYRIKRVFSYNLEDNKILRLRYGFYTLRSLNKFLVRNLEKKNFSRRFLKEAELVSFLEQRIDVNLFRLGFVSSLFEAKQLILHKKIFVNNNSNFQFSYSLKKGDCVSFCSSIQQKIKHNIQQNYKKRFFYFAQFSNLEVNWKTLKFIVILTKINLFQHLPHFSFHLNWKTFING